MHEWKSGNAFAGRVNFSVKQDIIFMIIPDNIDLQNQADKLKRAVELANSRYIELAANEENMRETEIKLQQQQKRHDEEMLKAVHEKVDKLKL